MFRIRGNAYSAAVGEGACICRCSEDSPDAALSIFTEGNTKGTGLNHAREN